MNPASEARAIFEETLRFADPQKLIPGILNYIQNEKKLHIQNKTFDLPDKTPVFIIGSGKASHTMARTVEKLLGNRVQSGIVISTEINPEGMEVVRVLAGSHPLPDQKSVDASRELLSFAKSVPENSVVINLVSGGTSSLFCLPQDELSIEDIRTIYKLLLESGATIYQINTVRKALSKVKGGRFLRYLEHTTLIDLVISDIPDDDLKMVGSGPSIAQEISPSEAIEVLKKLEIFEKIPKAAGDFLQREAKKESAGSEVFKTTDFEKHHTFLIASARQMAVKAAEIAEKSGYKTVISDEPWSGPIKNLENLIAKSITTHLPAGKKTALIFYGESTVEVTGSGTGGRNQELALRMAFQLQKMKADAQIVFLSAGTDGIDGPTDAAGAIVDRSSIEESAAKKINARTYLDNNDSYHFFEKAGGHIKTGGTGNNLMDLQIALIIPEM